MRPEKRLGVPDLFPRLMEIINTEWKGIHMQTSKKTCGPILMVFLFILGTAGCASMRNQFTVNNIKPMMNHTRSAVNRCPDVDLIKAAMPAGMLQLEGLIELVPDDRDLLVRAAESNQGYAFLFLQDTDPLLAAKYYQKARDYALRVLRQNRRFDAAMDQGQAEFVAALKTLNVEDVPALYFAAGAWMSWVGLTYKEKPEVLSDLNKIIAMEDRVIELDETFNYGGAHVSLGAYYASRPEQFGGRPEDAAFHFKQAFEISKEKFLLWQVLYGRYYAVQIKDRELFVKTLEKVLAAPEDLLVERNFANAVAKRKARQLLEKVDTFF